MSDSTGDIQPDLIEQVDALLEQIEETAKAYIPEEVRAMNSGALLTDDGAVAQPKPESAAQPESETPADSESIEEDAPTDSIASAQQALEALGDIEQQAEDLVGESIDALLDSTESSVEQTAAAEAAHTNDDLDLSIDEVQAASDDAVQSEELPESTDISEDALEDAIDSLLEEDTSNAEIDEELEALLQPLAEPEPDLSVDDAEESVAESSPETAMEEEPASLEEIEAALTIENTTPTSDALDDSMDLLDSALAEAADDMLEGDFETEEGELVSGEAVASAIETVIQESDPSENAAPAEASIEDVVDEIIEADSSDTSADDDDTASSETATATAEAASSPSAEQSDEPVTEAATASVPTPETEANAEIESEEVTPDSEVLEEIEALEQIEAAQPITVPAWFERSIEIVRPRIDRYDPLKGKTMDAVAAGLGAAIVLTLTHARPLAAKAVLVISKPLAKQSPEIRNAVGYIALWTGFLAMVVWIYLMMFRSPYIPQPESAPSRVINANEPMNPEPSSVLPES